MKANSDECIQFSTCISNGTIGLTCTCDTGYYDISATGGLCVPGLFPIKSHTNKTYICILYDYIFFCIKQFYILIHFCFAWYECLSMGLIWSTIVRQWCTLFVYSFIFQKVEDIDA